MDDKTMHRVDQEITAAWKNLVAGPAGYLRFAEAREEILRTAGITHGDWLEWYNSR
jgi:hypothetical protein